jgi:hypothetical protein
VINGGNNSTLEMYSGYTKFVELLAEVKKQEDAALFSSLHRYSDMDTRSGVLCGVILPLWVGI